MVTALGELIDGMRELMEDADEAAGGPAMAGRALYRGLGELVDFGEELMEAEPMMEARRVRQRIKAGMRPTPRGRTGRAKPKKRKKSAWNVFVAQEMPKVLKKHPRFTPQRAMKEVSRRWRNSPKNPNRRKRR